MRKSLLILLFVELLVAVALGQIAHVNRPALPRAFSEWRQRPTPETREAFERQKLITEGLRWAFSGMMFAGLAGTTIFVYWLRKGEPGTAGNSHPVVKPSVP